MGGVPYLRAVLLLTCIAHIHGQYYDLFQAFQPYVQPQPSQPLNFLNDFTTKRPRPKLRVVTENSDVKKLDRIPENNSRKTSEQTDKNKQSRKQTSAPLFDFNFFTTPKTQTKVTNSQRKSQNRHDSKQSSAIIFLDDHKTKSDNAHVQSNPRETDKRVKSRPSNRKTVNQPIIATNYDTNWYDSKISYDHTTRQPYDTTKAYQNINRNSYYTTHNPLLNRPGVKPAVVHGPPITNRPVTQRPVTQRPLTQRPVTQRPLTQRPVTQRPITQRPLQSPQVINLDDDLNVSPEVISGPDEDYMTAIEKKRYVEIAERMCDKYKSLDQKQVQAIPLLPSPQPVSVNVSTCSPTTVPLVVGGKVVTVKEFPHMVLLGWRKVKNRGYSWKCGGSLLSNQFILTAAHCAYQDRDDNVISGPPRVVQLGSSYLNDPKAVFKKVAAVIRHPKYKLPKAYYDLAIVKMDGPVTFSEAIKPACLGTPPPANSPIIATGWGKTEFGSQSQELRSVSIPVWDISDCYNALGVSMKIPYGPSSDSQLCAGERGGGKDTCQGDSGGPAQIQDGCIWRVVAVTSVGRYCGAVDTPAIYATVQRAFISAVIFKDQKTDNHDKDQQTNRQGDKQGINNQNYNREQSPVVTNQQNYNREQYPIVTNQQNYNREQSSISTNQQNYNREQSSISTNQQNYNREQYPIATNQQNYNREQSSISTNPQNYNREQYPISTNQQNYNREITATNAWNPTQNNEANNDYNNGESYSWNRDTQDQYGTNNQNEANRNEYNNFNYNVQTTNGYGKRDEYNPPLIQTENAKEFYNNYAGSNNFNSYKQDGSDGRGDYGNDGRVWWS